MKKIIFSAIMLVASMATFAQSETKVNAASNVSTTQTSQIQKDAFKSFTSHFSESAAFAYVTLGGRQLLLVSHETFGNNMNSDLEALEASIFALDAKGKIVALGSIRSQGTLYPVSTIGNELMVAGHRFVRAYSVRGEMPELQLDSYEEGEGEKIQKMFDKFEEAKPVLFSTMK